jgi:hypothetical protein
VILKYDRDQVLALRGALVGITGLLMLAVLPADNAVIAQGGILLALWLCFASVLAYAARHGTRSRAPGTSPIPLRFSGPTGRFTLRRQGDGRHVQVVSEGVVLAEVRATDLQDDIELHAVPSDGIEDLGSALGQAIQVASDADEAHLDWDDHGASEDWDTDQGCSARW